MGRASGRQASVSRIVDERNQQLGLLAVIVDLTERRQAERALREARDEAEAADRAKSRFLAAVSHDLRQPVMSANLFLDLLRKRQLSPAERDLVEPLANSLNGLTGMLNGLLEVARLDAGIVRAEPCAFPLNDLLQRLYGEFQRLARETHLQLHVPEAPWTVRSDPLLVELILRNLISNAFKYTEAGGVSIMAHAGDGTVAIDVTDTGRGIAPAELAHIFEDYYQGGNAARDHSRGFGIGLATARRVAALLGTDIEVRSEVGKGSTFTLSLPLAEGQRPSVREPRRTEGGPLAARSMLVVDDDPLVLQALELLLGSWGLLVHAASSRKHAEELLETMDHPPDIVLADYTLAHGELGTDVIADARRHGAAAAVLLTGDTSSARLAEAERSGYRLLHKPIAVDTLEAMLRELGRRLTLDGSPLEDIQPQRQNLPQPCGIVGVIDIIVTRDRVQQHRQAKTVEHQPRQKPGQERRRKRDLVHGPGVRPDQLIVPAAEPGFGEERSDTVAHGGRAVAAVRRIVIDMRVVFGDPLGIGDLAGVRDRFTSHFRSPIRTRSSTPS